MKAHPLHGPVLNPEEKPANSAVRYQLPEEPKAPLGMVFGLVVLIVVAVVAYCLFGR